MFRLFVLAPVFFIIFSSVTVLADSSSTMDQLLVHYLEDPATLEDFVSEIFKDPTLVQQNLDDLHLNVKNHFQAIDNTGEESKSIARRDLILIQILDKNLSEQREVFNETLSTDGLVFVGAFSVGALAGAATGGRRIPRAFIGGMIGLWGTTFYDVEVGSPNLSPVDLALLNKEALEELLAE